MSSLGRAYWLSLASVTAIGAGLIAASDPPSYAAAIQETRTENHLASFNSDAELRGFLAKRQKRLERRSLEMASPMAVADAEEQSIVVTGTAKADQITNNQEANVDEGGIVKKRGDLLVILRRGRLFTVSIAGGKLRPVDMIDAMPPGVSGGGDWYDEMLLHGDRVIVIGYSYARGGTEVNRFRLSPKGQLRFEDAYHLKSNDYYSSRNYASRLIGNRLVYYTPLYLSWGSDPFDAFPAVRRWRGDEDARFKRITSARETFIVPSLRDNPEAPIDTLHSVVDCDLTAAELDCKATAVLGPASRNFYVSSDAVYLWVSDEGSWQSAARQGARSHVYRLPLGREKPSAIAARGSPTDQFSFREDKAAGLLDILVRAEGGGDWMWNSEVSNGAVALLSIPLRRFGDGSREVPLDRYRDLPHPGEDAWNFQNRFVGNHVLYGGGDFGDGDEAMLVVAGLRGGPVSTMKLSHAVERIDSLGSDAVVVGSNPDEALGFTAVDLSGRRARIGDLFVLPSASQGESRSHGFFYRSDDEDGRNGLLGLPIAREAAPAYHRFFGSSAAMLFLRRANKRFNPAGELGAQVEGVSDDKCKASCVDWYGNARPIFAEGRIFALLGYELVEGRLGRGGIREVGRVNFAPSERLLAQRN